ncbi:MAG: LysR family transcriptional regulator [Synergistaceae bacterium]|nr:LysR family transcriptional regulator [Synergistaceae bacterium]MBQ6971543.1 LysR family transcriptional regulator [Synergistaceae bacterium]
MTLQQLRYFCETAKELSFRRAAKYLRIAQPSLSSAIAHLEDELGFLLFERKGRHIELTRYGKYYHQQIQPLLEQIDFITDKTRMFARGDTGHIDLAYNTPFGKMLVPKMAREFLEIPENGQCRFHFHQASSPRIIEGIQRGRFDVGVCTMEPVMPGITYIPLMRQELVGIVPRGHELSGRKEIELAELTEYPYVDYTDEAGLHSLIHMFLDRAGLSPKITAKAPDEDSIAALVAEGFGVSFVASIYSLKNYDIDVIPVKGDDCYRTIYVVHSEEHYLTPAVQRFIQYGVSISVKEGQLPFYDED